MTRMLPKLLPVLLLAGVLAGCGGSEAAPPSAAPTSSGTNSTTATTTTPTTAVPTSLAVTVTTEPPETTTTTVVQTTSTTTEPTEPAELVVNGGFENPELPAGTYGMTGSMPGWPLSLGSLIEIHHRVSGQPHEGNQHVELDSDGNSGIYQDLSTVPGAAYLLSFAYSPRPERSADDNTILVFWDGDLVMTIGESGVGLSDTAWTVETIAVVAATDISRVEFRADGESTSFGGYLDAVSVVAAG